MKVKCEIVAQDWDGIIPAPHRQEVRRHHGRHVDHRRAQEGDRLLALLRQRPERLRWCRRTRRSPRCRAPGQRFNLDTQAAEAEKAIDAIKPLLKGKTVGVQGSTIHANFADKYLKGDVEVREYKSTEAHDLDLAAGRIDAVLADATTLRGTLEKPEFKDFVLVGPGFTGGMLGKGVGVGLRKDDAELKKMFDDAIEAAIKRRHRQEALGEVVQDRPDAA